MKTSITFLTLLFPAATSLALGDTFGSGANTFNINFVTIGNPGNVADFSGSPNPAGSVSYIYNMGKFEVSRDMVTKANTLASLGVPLSDMTAYGGNGVNRPATGVSWNQAARFVNWLDTSTGSPPAYKFAIQPGEVGYDPNADIQLWTPSDAGYNPNNLYRNSQARYFLPSANEWYKAAYYNPTSGVYYAFPTGSNNFPTGVASGTASGTAVNGFQPGPADITLAGGLSPYGTMAQGGNVYEMEETAFALVNNSVSSQRGLRGGDWQEATSPMVAVMSSVFRVPYTQNFGSYRIGFRVASIDIPLPIIGDYNGNGIVDAADYVLWRKGGPLQNQGDDPNNVNQADYTFWRSRFGVTSGSASEFASAIPEPSSLLLAIVAFAALATHRRKTAALAFASNKRR